MSILDVLNGLTAAADHVAVEQVPMSDKQIEEYSAKLKKQNRMNVYANRFDINKPFRVRTRKAVKGGFEYTGYGNFTDVDVAAAVGSLVSASIYGKKALRGNFDQAKAEAHPEFQAWLVDDRNQAILKKVANG